MQDTHQLAPLAVDTICPPEDIFDAAAFAQALIKAQQDDAAPMDVRNAIVGWLQQAQKQGRAAIAEAFAKRPFAARETTAAYTYLTDQLVQATMTLATQVIHPNVSPTAGERLSLIAVGGYGRGEMAPFSDVDLLFLTPYKITAWAENVIETMLYMLWDLRLKVGHSSRTVKDCIRLGREDFTIRTAMLEHRFIGGDYALAELLDKRLWDELFSGTARDFVEAKLHERDERHKRQGQRYVVEPNVKEGKGGLRDLQSLFWIAKYIHGVQDTADLVQLGVFTEDEFASFAAAESFLWAVRCHLHLLTGRATEQLTFDMQVQVAEAMGYEDKAGRRAVEVFMQAYFLHATEVGDLTRIFLTGLEADHLKAEPLLERLLGRRRKIKSGYEVIHNRIAIIDDAAFLADPLNILRLFEEALRTGMLIHPDAMRLVKANLKLIDDTVRNSPEAQRIFMDLLLKHGNPERALRRMNELGVLGAIIPEFKPIVAMMQFNMYHSYTVDEHIIQTIMSLSEIENGDLVEDLPVATSILKSGVNRRVLYAALLLHDIGKGREEDHSILGAQIARKVGPRLGLKPDEVDTVEWLVRYHLLMSDMAQKRDIADPRTVRDFAKAVRTVERLDLLCVLTVCDIRGVGPNTWNNWKAVLIRALYRQTRTALEDGMEALNRENRGAEAKKALRTALADWPRKDLQTETSRHYDPYWQGLHQTAHVVFANLLRGIGDDEIRIDLHPDEDRDATRVCFVMQDHPGIFARLAGALALVGANVVDARSYTTKDGYVTDAFWIQDADDTPYDASRLPRLRKMIERTLHGEVVTREAMVDRDKVKKREKVFRVPTHITFDNDGSDIYTIIEVDTRDRPGLLHDLARTLASSNVYVANAVIATYGEQCVDTFYVKDMFGLKYYTPSKQRTLEKRLRAAIVEGAQRAEQ
ncbi:[protein-PII] uridylyltransferase [Pseudosulfitobacter pseudonitzschiae]|uniref:[protein-PII] uridylyltransferase n=1 Tax=Pseudosulfitobacter pseudonitzschiae TaxID=1402135 RepID=UPI00056C52CB|nr:[protein-PII] uridylyltransferase [Pseudosulfitobacter pseudonitzschiae]MBM1816045.1 [protein-PII] uridylyltransferase [Pseudosulfitobacter pseudonitzschiae]MBM1833351.1 [protein-PII] uridylyltransferase [Pseudosulfitobacter pseudonitzschiae]MBM1838218.1 [protein-PII] uridylyltransferase [Pseudosulfitobacter pseudonitzschiae]MBM1842750.1 [protein-PII] uridylyltransferase [Pseudosulfitobacter pseudonitzschiae]MBM1847616.1 [protein-PII] uridylyltransferase [Pseudosulfitobacter pseudonitzschia